MKKKELKKLLNSRDKQLLDIRKDLIKAIRELPEGGLKHDLNNKYKPLLFESLQLDLPIHLKALIEKYGNTSFEWFELGENKKAPE